MDKEYELQDLDYQTDNPDNLNDDYKSVYSLDNSEIIHDIVYETVFELKNYVSENILPMLENFKYSDFFDLIEDQITL